MKKVLCLILIFNFLFAEAVLASPQTSDNSFEIPIDSVPPGDAAGGKSGGLSSGAVTAITLGSVFGGITAIGGLGWYLSGKSGLASGFACGCNSPYSTIKIDDYLILGKLKKDNCENKYLIKAFEYINPEEETSKKYLVVPDLDIKSKSYNTIFFDLPLSDNLNKVKIIQVSDPFTMKSSLPGINSKIILNPKSKDSYELPTTVDEGDFENGILIKRGIISKYGDKTAVLITENRMNHSKVYAVIVEFSK